MLSRQFITTLIYKEVTLFVFSQWFLNVTDVEKVIFNYLSLSYLHYSLSWSMAINLQGGRDWSLLTMETWNLCRKLHQPSVYNHTDLLGEAKQLRWCPVVIFFILSYLSYTIYIPQGDCCIFACKEVAFWGYSKKKNQ